MKKEKKYILNQQNYFLGKNADGESVWLVAPSWDCGWYWGFGYLEIYNKQKTDIISHTHFDGLGRCCNLFDGFKKEITETPLTDGEIWTLCDYMCSFYTLKETAELFGRGYSYYTGTAKLEDLKQVDLVEEINKKMLPLLFDKIDKLLTPASE